jgi:hypothetical protein
MLRSATVIPFPAPIVVSKGTTTMSTPTHAGGLKFEIGQAVYIARFPEAFKRPMTPVPAAITSMGQRFATVQTDAGPKRVDFRDLLPRGYCAACDQAAIVGGAGQLVCPRCAGDASAPPPRERMPQWEGRDTSTDVRYHMLTTGCLRKEAHNTVCQRQYEQEREEAAARKAAREAEYERARAEWRKLPSYRLIGTMINLQDAVDAMAPEQAAAVIAQIEQLLTRPDVAAALASSVERRQKDKAAKLKHAA